MPTGVHRIVAVSTGFPGAPGYTAFHFALTADSESDGQFHAVKAFLNAVKPYFPGAWSTQIEASGQVLDPVTGTLVTFTAVPGIDAAPITGSASSGFGAGVAGSVIGLNTGTINWTRRVRGRIFLVPLSAGSYQVDGTLTDAWLGDSTAAGNGLMTAAVGFSVWSRPRSGAGGKLAPVTSVHVNDKAAFLSSRRA